MIELPRDITDPLGLHVQLAVLLSSEAQEVMRVASRCYVMYHGRIMDCLSAEQMSEKEIMRLATGVEEQ